MTKVYLVTMHECGKDGLTKMGGRTLIDEVFTNKKLAIEFVNSMNETYWKYEKTWYWTYQTMTICKASIKELPY